MYLDINQTSGNIQ